MTIPRTIPTEANPDLLTFTIKIDGDALSGIYQVGDILVRKAINKIPAATIKIFDGNPSAETFAASDAVIFIPGKSIEISMGYHSQETTLFKGIIITHSNTITESLSELVIECRDVAVRMTVGCNSKHYNDVTNSEVAEEIISKYPGISAAVEATSMQHNNLVQYNTTDWDFIVSQMDSIGYICLINDGVFTIKKPALNENEKLNVLYGATILTYNADMDARQQFKTVVAAAWDFSSQAVVETSAAEPSWVEGGNISNATLADTINLEQYKIIHPGKITQDELQAWADAKLMKTRLSKIKGTVKYIGNANVKPGDFIGLNGVGDRFTGKAIASAVLHEAADGLWTTTVHFGMEPDWFAETVAVKNTVLQKGLIPSVQGLLIGVVTNLEDSEGEHRVQVRIPVINNNEDGIWARIATLDAGNSRGTFFLPEIGDEVIVGCISNDPSHMVILGMLNSSAMPAPLTAANDNHEKGYVSRSQLKMIFNDEEKSFKLQTPGGNKISLSDADELIKIEDQHGNRITMEAAGITIESAGDIKLKAAANLTVEATNVTVSPSASFAVSAGGAEIKAGSGSAELKAPSVKIAGAGITDIKGGLVTIN